jgi:hypothetical protein
MAMRQTRVVDFRYRPFSVRDHCRGAMDDTSTTSAPSETGRTPPPGALFPLSHRVVALAALLAGCAVTYSLLLAQFDLSKGPTEAEFGAPSSDARVRLYLQPTQVDPVNDSLQMRISVVPDPSAGDAATIADRDYLLKIRRGKQTEHVQIRASQPLPEVTFDFDLDSGDVRDYPLDRYVSVIGLVASERAQDGSERPLPIHATAWEGILGFSLKGQQIVAQQPNELRLQFDIRRTGAVSFFGVTLYGAMIVISVCALVVGGLVFVGIRQIDLTLLGALGAMIFALPARRNALPGAPPLGVRADILIFFRSELGAVIALCLFVTAWARRGL